MPIETLVDRVWGDEPPAEARNVLYSHLSRIRQLLRQAAGLGDEPTVRLERRHAGYVLDIEPDLVDLHRFGRLSDQGRDQSRGTAERARALAAALGLWRGPPLTGLPGEWAARRPRGAGAGAAWTPPSTGPGPSSGSATPTW